MSLSISEMGDSHAVSVPVQLYINYVHDSSWHSSLLSSES